MTPRPICEPVELSLGASVVVGQVRHPPTSPELGRLPHFHDVSELVLFERVRGSFFADGRCFALANGSIAFVPSMRHHDFVLGAGRKSWLLVQIDPYVVEQLALQPVFARLARPFCARPGADQQRRIGALAEWLTAAAAADPHDPVVVRIVELLLIAVLDAPEAEGSESTSGEANVERLLPAVERLRLDPSARTALADAAASCSLSPAYFSRRFKHVFGMNFTDYARAYRLHLAARRIASGSASVSEIAFSLGFASPSHFTARFHERFGVTPREYRRGTRRRPD